MNPYRLFQALAVIAALAGAIWASLGLAQIVGGHSSEGLTALVIGGINFLASLAFGKWSRRFRP